MRLIFTQEQQKTSTFPSPGNDTANIPHTITNKLVIAKKAVGSSTFEISETVLTSTMQLFEIDKLAIAADQNGKFHLLYNFLEQGSYAERFTTPAPKYSVFYMSDGSGSVETKPMWSYQRASGYGNYAEFTFVGIQLEH